MRSDEVRMALGVNIEKAFLAKGKTREDLATVLEKRPDLYETCAAALVSASDQIKAERELTLKTAEGESFEKFMEDGAYDWRNDWITKDRFPIRKATSGRREIVLLHFGCDISTQAVLEEGKRRGLKRPTYEDCFRFGAQHPEIQREFPVVFLHEPVPAPHGHEDVVYLLRSGAERSLHLRWIDSDWSGHCRFAFVREDAAPMFRLVNDEVVIQVPALTRPTREQIAKVFPWKIREIERDTSPEMAVTFHLATVLKSRDGSHVNGAEYEKRLKPHQKICVGLQQAQWLVEHQDEYPAFKALLGKVYIDCPGLVVVDERGDRCVPYLGSGGERFFVDWNDLDHGFDVSGRIGVSSPPTA